MSSPDGTADKAVPFPFVGVLLGAMPAFRGARVPPGGLPHTERHSARVLSLPLHPALADEDVLEVCRALDGAAAAG